MSRRVGSKVGERTGSKRTFYLDDETVAKARLIGEGSTSEGIRRAVNLSSHIAAMMNAGAVSGEDILKVFRECSQ